LIPRLESRLKLLPKSWQLNEDRPMNWTTFPQKTQNQTKKSAKNLSVSARFAQLRRLADGNPLKAYIEDHEATALILLTILMIAGTVLYGHFQPPPDAGSGQPQSSASSKLAEAPIQERPSDELSAPPVQENPPDVGPGISNPPSQPSGLISSGKRDNQLVKRKAHHHHRR
jgi:hypothetical protein